MFRAMDEITKQMLSKDIISPETYQECWDAAGNLCKRYIPGKGGLNKIIVDFGKSELVIQVHNQYRRKYCKIFEFWPQRSDNAEEWQRLIDWLEGRTIE